MHINTCAQKLWKYSVKLMLFVTLKVNYMFIVFENFISYRAKCSLSYPQKRLLDMD